MEVALTDEWKGKIAALFKDVREDEAVRRHCRSPTEPMPTGQLVGILQKTC